MSMKWTLVLLIVFLAYVLLQEGTEEGLWSGMFGSAHSDVAYSEAAASSDFKCALLGTGPMSDGFRKDAFWRPNANVTMGLACMDPALLSRPTAVASTD